MNEPWYELAAADAPLTQGDLIFDCPLVTWDSSAQGHADGETAEPSLKDLLRAFREDVLVLTQACDLEHHKVENVVLCPHVPLSAFRQVWEAWMLSRKQGLSEKAWKNACQDIADGYVWNQTFLNRFDHADLGMDVRVVDFHDLFTVPRTFLETQLRRRGQPRLRLRPPYREHLSQAFARFFMRVGLPQSVDKVW